MYSDDIEYNEYSVALDNNDYSSYSGVTDRRRVNTTSSHNYFLFLVLVLGIPIALSGIQGIGSFFLLLWAYYSFKERRNKR